MRQACLNQVWCQKQRLTDTTAHISVSSWCADHKQRQNDESTGRTDRSDTAAFRRLLRRTNLCGGML